MNLSDVEAAATRVAKAHKRYHDESQDLNQMIREAHKAGASLREIAKAAQLSHESVRRVVTVDA